MTKSANREHIAGLGARWLCPDCGRVLDKPPYRVRENNPEGFDPGYYHAWKCRRPMVPCVVTETP